MFIYSANVLSIINLDFNSLVKLGIDTIHQILTEYPTPEGIPYSYAVSENVVCCQNELFN